MNVSGESRFRRTGVVHDVDVRPQFGAGQVVAVLDRVVQGRQQDEQDHGVDELGGGAREHIQHGIKSETDDFVHLIYQYLRNIILIFFGRIGFRQGEKGTVILS